MFWKPGGGAVCACKRTAMMSSATYDIWKMSINDYDFWTQTYDISSRNTEHILVFLGPREKSKFESRITAFANTLLLTSNFLVLFRAVAFYRRFLRVSGKKFAQQIPNVISVKQLREKYENVMQCSVDKEIFKKFLGGTYCLKAFLSKYN